VPDTPGPETYPRKPQAIELRQGDTVVQVRPLATVQTLSKHTAIANRLIVVFRSPGSDAERETSHRLASSRGAGQSRPLMKLGAKGVLVDVTGATSLESAARAYAADPNVLGASPDWVTKASEVPNDPYFGNQWSLNTIHAPEAWNRSHGSTGVRIAILDTGINEAHPDLAGKVIARKDFTGSSSGTNDIVGHGTHVAGIAAAATNNSAGVAGVAYNSRLLNVKVLDDFGSGSISMLYSGIYWATANGAHVMNMSLGAEQDCGTSWWEDLFDIGRNELRDAINNAWSKNIVLVAAAGNRGVNEQQWPGACPNVVSVAATTRTDTRASFSNFGTWVDLAAPGQTVFSTAVPGAKSCQTGLVGQFAYCSGTSMASPQVAGLAALVKASCGFHTSSGVVSRLTSTAVPIAGTGTLWKHGRIDALRAVCFPVPGNFRLGAVTSSSVQLLWNDSIPGETRFEIHRQAVGSNTVSTVQVPANTTAWTHTGLTSGASFDYRIRACDPAGCSAWSAPVRVTLGPKLTVTIVGQGEVTSSPAGISCGRNATDCSENFKPGTSVTLTPIPYENLVHEIMFEFSHWEGSCSGQPYQCKLSMIGSKSAKAIFIRVPVIP
jgi:thermitase